MFKCLLFLDRKTFLALDQTPLEKNIINYSLLQTTNYLASIHFILIL